MSRVISLTVILAILLMAVPAMPANAETAIEPDATICTSEHGLYGTDPLGSNYCYWEPPANWNGDLVIFAHGYVDPSVPNGTIPWDQLVLDASSGLTLPQVLVGMNYAFMVPSYPKNGLAVVEGEQDVLYLAQAFKQLHPGAHVFLVGASEGGLVTSLAIEKNTNHAFDGGVTTCGPVGDFTKQIDYWGDFRVLFDYFFRNEKQFMPLPVSPVNIADSTLAAWTNPDPTQNLQTWILAALQANPAATSQLIKVSHAPIDTNDPTSIAKTVLGILDYNIKATNEARAEFAGGSVDLSTNDYQPFSNKYQWYWGSQNDWALNLWVTQNGERFSADPRAIAVINSQYQTTGRIKAPLVAMHTTGDPIVPYWHELLYALKVWRTGNASQFFSIPVLRYGHCAFTPQEAIFAFVVMIYKATGQLPFALLSPQADNPYQVLTLQDYNDMMQKYESMQPEPTAVYIPLVSH